MNAPREPSLFDRQGTHPTHRMHAHSIRAYDALNPAPRQKAILDALRAAGKPLSDREVCSALARTDPNYVRPRITDLIGCGVLRELGAIIDPVTGRKVRTVWFAEENAHA